MDADLVREREATARLRQRLWGAAVLIALAVVGLPLLLDGSGSESQFRRVERLREEPPRIVVAGEPRRPARSGSPGLLPPEPAAPVSPIPPDAPAAAFPDADRADVDGAAGRQALEAGRGPDIRVGEDDPPDYLRDTPSDAARDAPATAARHARPNAARGAARDAAAVQPLHAWVVQAGSFREQENAIAVRDRLRRAGYPSFVTDTSMRGGPTLGAERAPLFRVQVGPMVDRARAATTRDAIVEMLGREAIVVAYP